MKQLQYIAGIILCSIFSLALLNVTAQAQERGMDEPRQSPNAAVSQTIGTTQIMITYGRPAVKGREVFGGLEAFGEVWRTGANESTVIVLPTDVTIEGEEVPAGTYSIYTIPGEDEWTIIINEKLSWGTGYDESEDLIRVTTTPEEGVPMEQFMIYFENVTDTSADIVLHWDTTKVPFTIEV